MDDSLRASLGHGAAHGLGIERIRDRRLGAEGAHGLRALRRADHAGDVVTRCQQLGDEPAPDDAGRAGQEDPHATAAGLPSVAALALLPLAPSPPPCRCGAAGSAIAVRLES